MLSVNHNLDRRGMVVPAPAQVSEIENQTASAVIVAAACACILMLSMIESFASLGGVVAVYYIAKKAMKASRSSPDHQDNQGVVRSASAQTSARNTKLKAIAGISMGAFACLALLSGGGFTALAGIVAVYHLTVEAMTTRGSQR
ncbi:MAG: hypothetical protein ACOYKZ_05085 [Chlamydiia bacterium]